MWNFMQVELSPKDMLARPMIGPGELTREAAHAEIQGILDRAAADSPAFRETARLWKAGAKDDTVYGGPFVWTIYEHPEGEDPRRAALAWLEDFANIMREAGMTNIQVAAMPPSR